MSFFGLFGPPDVEKLKAKQDVKGLVKALSYEKDAAVRKTAAQAIREIAENKWIGRYDSQSLLRKEDAHSVLGVLAFDDPDERVRQAAAEALAVFGEDIAIEKMRDRLKAADEEIRARARALLPQLGSAMVGLLLVRVGNRPENAVEATSFIKEIGLGILLDWLRKDKDWGFDYDSKVTGEKGKVRVLQALGTEDIALLEDMLKDGNYSVRKTILEAAAQIEGDQAQELLVRLLEGQSASLSREAWKALKSRNWQPTNDRQRAFVAVASYAWEECERLGEAAAEPLIFLLQAKEYGFSEMAAKTLGKIKSKQAIVPLVKALGDQHYQIRRGDTFSGILSGTGAAGRSLDFDLREKSEAALIEIGDPGAIVPLTEAITSDPEAAPAALRVLGKLLETVGSRAAPMDLHKVAELPESVNARFHKIGIIRGDGTAEVESGQHLLSCSAVKALANEELNRRGEQT